MNNIALPLDSILKLFLGGGAVVAGILIAISLFRIKRTNDRSAFYLALLILAYSLFLLNMLLAESGLMSRFKDLYFIPLIYTLSFGPLVWHFVKHRLQPLSTPSKLSFIHWIFPIAQGLFYWLVGFRSYEYKSELWNTVVNPWFQHTEAVLFYISFGIYLWWSFSIINHTPITNKWQSELHLWLKKLLIFLAIPIAINLCYDLVDTIAWERYDYNLYNTPWLSLPKNLASIFIGYWLAFNGFLYLHPEKRSWITRTRTPVAEVPAEALSPVIDHITRERAFANPEITLDLLARETGMTPVALSQLLNRSYGKNFNDFVNQYRVEAVKQMLEDPANDHFTLLAIAMECGFNSKSTFNRVFKAATGYSPKAYKDQARGVK